MRKENCSHKNTITHNHRVKNYPFGKKSKPRFMRIKRVTIHCEECKKIIGEYKKWLIS